MKTQIKNVALPASTSTANNANVASVNASGWASLIVQFDGTFVGSYVLEGSIDGVTWFDMTTLFVEASTNSAAVDPVTAPGLFFLEGAGNPPPNVRARCTAFTSVTGTPMVRFCGLDSRTT